MDNVIKALDNASEYTFIYIRNLQSRLNIKASFYIHIRLS